MDLFYNECDMVDGGSQWDQIGRFLKLFATNYRIKLAQISDNYFGYFEVYHALRKNYYVYFFGRLL